MPSQYRMRSDEWRAQAVVQIEEYHVRRRWAPQRLQRRCGALLHMLDACKKSQREGDRLDVHRTVASVVAQGLVVVQHGLHRGRCCRTHPGGVACAPTSKGVAGGRASLKKVGVRASQPAVRKPREEFARCGELVCLGALFQSSEFFEEDHAVIEHTCTYHSSSIATITL